MSSSEIQHARDYVTRVKTSLGQNSNQYKLFLTTLKSYRTRQLSPTQVISRINDIFSEDNVVESGNRRELILGFNWFLPPEYQLSADDITTSKSSKRKKKDTEASRTRKRVRAPIVSTSTTTTKQSKSKSNNKKETTSKNIKVTSYASVRPSSSSTTLPKGYSTITKNLNRKKINVSTTEIILSPPKSLPSDLLHVTDSNTSKSKPNYNLLNSPAKSIDSNHSAYTEHVECKLCNGDRDEQAVNEPVLLCELKGCNAEYHLGCLYAYCPNLFDEKNGKEGSGKDGSEKEGAMEVEFVAKEGGVSEKAPRLPQDQPPLSHNGELQVPSGDIYCTSCYANGSTSVLTKYFDKTDNDRSNYTCNRAYVMALLEKHMRLNPTGNMGNGWDNTTGLQHLKAPPRSELWYAHEVNVQALGIENNDNEEGSKGKKKNAEDINDEFLGEKGAEMLVGKSVRLYNNLDNEYHVGRIVDWRACTVYPPLYEHNDGPHVTKNNTVQLKDLEYYGIGSLSTTEFLVRFPAGLQGRKKELLRWIMLEEHSLAVGVSLIEGKTSMKKAGGVGGGTTNIDEWKPAMVLARSALELVTVRQFLKEDDKGNLFAAANMTTKGKSKGDGSKGDDRWALASFFGEEQHELLHLRDEARDLMDCPSLVNNDASNGVNGSGGNGQATKQEEEGEEDAQPRPRGPLASVDVPLSLALAEHNEQERCKGWSQLILQESGHPQALVSPDEYSMQLSLDKKSKVSESNGSTVSAETNGDTSATTPEDSKNVSNTSSIRPLVQWGMDRLWLAQLVEKAAASSSSDDSMQLSKDTIMSFKFEHVPSMSTAMASLQKI